VARGKSNRSIVNTGRVVDLADGTDLVAWLRELDSPHDQAAVVETFWFGRVSNAIAAASAHSGGAR
jgi:hypothetical protein